MSDFHVIAQAIREEAGLVTLRITGQANVSSVGGLLLRLADTCEHADEVVIDLSGVTDIDVDGLRLFCSCHRSSIFSNREFRITGQEQPAIWKVAASIGNHRKLGCAIDSQHTCIWTGAHSDGKISAVA